MHRQCLTCASFVLLLCKHFCRFHSNQISFCFQSFGSLSLFCLVWIFFFFHFAFYSFMPRWILLLHCASHFLFCIYIVVSWLYRVRCLILFFFSLFHLQLFFFLFFVHSSYWLWIVTVAAVVVCDFWAICSTLIQVSQFKLLVFGVIIFVLQYTHTQTHTYKERKYRQKNTAK